jgi:hypothetical protein
MKPCFERQVQDKLKITPAMSKAFMEEALNHVKAGLSTSEVFQAIAERSGLSLNTVAKVLQADSRLFSISKQAFARQNMARQIKMTAKQLAEEGMSGGKVRQSWNVLRRVVLAGHSPVFPFTHLRNLLYGSKFERQIFYQAVHDAWRYRGEKGAAVHEMDMALLKLSDHYETFKAWGLDIREGIHPGDIVLANQGKSGAAQAIRENTFAKLLRIDPANATRTFDALKIARYKLMKEYWDRADPALKSEEFGQILARELNYATGSVMEPRGAAATKGDRAIAALSKSTGDVLLSSKLFYAKRMEAFNLIRFGTQKLVKGGRMTPAERAIANIALKRWGRIAATQLSILGVNYAFAKAFGFETPNLTDPNKANWMRLRIGKFVIPLSPLMEAVREPIRAVATAIQRRDIYEGGKQLARPVLNAMHPSASLLLEQVTGKESFSGRPVPSIRNYVQPIKKSKQPAETVKEYVTTRVSPIAISGGLNEFYQALREEGVEAGMATAFIKGAAGGLTSGLAGTHIYEESERQKHATREKARIKLY